MKVKALPYLNDASISWVARVCFVNHVLTQAENTAALRPGRRQEHREAAV
jgi:hypothetical protein